MSQPSGKSTSASKHRVHLNGGGGKRFDDQASRRTIIQHISRVEKEIEVLRSCMYRPISPSPVSHTTLEILKDFSKTVGEYYSRKLVPRIRELQGERQYLAAAYNARLPIHGLPVEILSTIFSLATLGSTVLVPWLEYHLPLMTISLAHVCRLWRSVVQGCKELWSCLDLAYPRLSHYILARSKKSLTVFYGLEMGQPSRKSSNYLSYILSQHLCRVRHLILCVACDSPKVPGGGLSSASALEALIIFPRLGGAEGSILDTFIDTNLPRIRYLEVGSCPLEWSELPLSATLTHLEIRNKEHSDEGLAYYPSVTGFLSSLETLQNLQYLSLTNMLPDFSSSPPPSTLLPITLPVIQRLEITDTASDTASFFRCIRIPVGTITGAHCDAHHQAQDEEPIARVVDGIFTAFETSYTDNRNVDTLYVSFAGVDVHYRSTRHNLPDLPNLTISDVDQGLEVPDLLEALVVHLNFATLTSLVIDGATVMSMRCDISWPFFRRLPYLQAITLQTIDLDFTETMDETPSPPFSDPSSPYFPALSILEFSGVDEDEYEYDMEECTRRLIEACKKRARCGFPLSELHIIESDCFHAEHVGSIKESVPQLTVIWDGYYLCKEYCTSCGYDVRDCRGIDH